MQTLGFWVGGMLAWTVVCMTLSVDTQAQVSNSAFHGNQVFQNWCSHCHGPGPGHPGTTALQAKYQGNPVALLEQRTDLSTAFVKFYVRHGVSIMPVFRKTEISDADLDDLALYLSKTNR